MYIKISWDEDFDTLMMHLWAKYGRDLFTIDGIGDQLDLNAFARGFFNNTSTTADVSVDANANVTSKSVIDFDFEMSKPLKRYNSYYLMWKELRTLYDLETANRLIEDQLNGRIYINDFSDVGKPYCFNYSCNDLIHSGLPMSSRLSIYKPKSLQSYIRQVEQFTVYAANSTLGATGLADFLICASILVDKIISSGYDGHILVEDIDTYVRELLTSFIYTINWEFRGNQSPFTNISIYDEFFLEELCGDYGANIESVKHVQNIFLDAYEHEFKRTQLTFPVLTACMSIDEDRNIKDTLFKYQVATRNKQYGYINFYYGDSSTLSSCCRLRSNIRNEYFNSFGSGSTKIGSLGVVTCNFPRLALLSDSISDFKNNIRDMVIDIAKINNAKRSIISDRIDRGSMPLYSLGYMQLSKQYSTFGVTGLNESLLRFGVDITSTDGQTLVLEILSIINETNSQMEAKYNAPHNCEQVPAESSAVTLATKDSYLGHNPIGYKLYSNQFIPLTTNANILDRIRIQGKFDSEFSGGAVCHVNIGTEIKDTKTLVDLMDYAAKCGVVYWAVNYALRRCPNGHCFVDGDTCPVCAEKYSDTITRVVGFYTNTKHWNKTRREYDWPKRRFY